MLADALRDELIARQTPKQTQIVGIINSGFPRESQSIHSELDSEQYYIITRVSVTWYNPLQQQGGNDSKILLDHCHRFWGTKRQRNSLPS